MPPIKNVVRKATATPRAKIISLSILAIFFFGLGSGIYYWSIHKKKIIKDEIDKTLVKKTAGLYSVSYEKFELDEVAGSLLITNCSLAYDSTILGLQKNVDQQPSMVFNINIPTISITGVQTPKALIDKELAGEVITLVNPTIELLYTGKGKDSTRVVPKDEMVRQVLGQLLSIKVKEVNITNAHLLIRHWNKSDTTLNVLGVNLGLKEVAIDSSTAYDSTRFLFARKIYAAVEAVKWKNKNGLYAFEIDSLLLNSSENFLAINDFRMEPILSEDQFMRKRGVQTDRLDINLQKIQVFGLGFRKLLEQSIEADSLYVGKGDVKVYKDMGLPRDGVSRVGTFPHQMIKKLPMNLIIKKAVIANTYVEYKQLTPKTGSKGKISFHDIRVDMSNITNNPDLIQRNPFWIADARTRFLNLANLQARFRFDLRSKNGGFDISAQLGSLPATALNSVAQPLASAKLEDGTINGAEIYVKGSDYRGSSTVTMRYKDLKLAVLEKDEDNGKLNKKGLISAAANMLVKNDNPGKNGKLRVGKGIFERDTNRSFFNLVWKSMFVAIAENLGVKAKTKPVP